MRRLQGAQDVARQGEDLLGRQRPLPQPLGEREAFDVLQDEPVAVRRLEQVVDPDDGRDGRAAPRRAPRGGSARGGADRPPPPAGSASGPRGARAARPRRRRPRPCRRRRASVPGGRGRPARGSMISPIPSSVRRILRPCGETRRSSAAASRSPPARSRADAISSRLRSAALRIAPWRSTRA